MVCYTCKQLWLRVGPDICCPLPGERAWIPLGQHFFNSLTSMYNKEIRQSFSQLISPVFSFGIMHTVARRDSDKKWCSCHRSLKVSTNGGMTGCRARWTADLLSPLSLRTHSSFLHSTAVYLPSLLHQRGDTSCGTWVVRQARGIITFRNHATSQTFSVHLPCRIAKMALDRHLAPHQWKPATHRTATEYRRPWTVWHRSPLLWIEVSRQHNPWHPLPPKHPSIRNNTWMLL